MLMFLIIKIISVISYGFQIIELLAAQGTEQELTALMVAFVKVQVGDELKVAVML